MNQPSSIFWSISTAEMLQKLETVKEGLTNAEALQRLTRYGANLLKPPKRSDTVTLLIAQSAIFATGLSCINID
jgi:Mg2+-importing ATPase